MIIEQNIDKNIENYLEGIQTVFQKFDNVLINNVDTL